MRTSTIVKAFASLIAVALLVTACAPGVVPTAQVIQQTVEVTRVVPGQAPTPVEEPIRLVTPGKLTVGFYPAPGASELDSNGQPAGVEIELMAEIAKRMGLQADYQPFDKPSAISALISGRVDALAAGLSIQPPRAQVVYFTQPWLLQAEGISVLPGTSITSWEEAAQKNETLATTVGDSHIPTWEALNIKIHTFDNIDACFLDVVNKGASGCAVGTFDLMYRKATAPTSAISKLSVSAVSGPTIFADLNAMAVAKDNAALGRKISQLMIDMWRDGTVEKVYHHVFGDNDVSIFINSPRGSALYYPGPWESGVFIPSSPISPTVTTVTPGKLTVGVVANPIMLKLNGEALSGPEATILQFAADKLGLQVKAVAVDDPATAVRDGQVDLIAGALPATEADSHLYWQSMPIGFNPDYIYVLPGPSFTSWEDVAKAGGKLAVVTGNARTADLKAAGVDYLEVPDAATGLKDLVDKTVSGLVISTPEFNAAVSSDATLVNAGIGWVRNTDLYTHGDAYVWGVKAGNGQLLDGLNQEIVAAWQGLTIADAYRSAFPGANITSLMAPGPTAIGSSFSSANDYLLRGIWLPGPWLQRPGWVK